MALKFNSTCRVWTATVHMGTGHEDSRGLSAPATGAPLGVFHGIKLRLGEWQHFQECQRNQGFCQRTQG